MSLLLKSVEYSFFFQAEDGIRDIGVTGVQTCALPIFDTVGGLTFLLAGRILAPGESVLHPSGWRLESVDADDRRIKRVRLHAPEEREELEDRKSVVEGKSVDLGGRRIIKKKKSTTHII